MNIIGYDAGVADAEIDLLENWVGASENLDSIVNQLRVALGASDAYIAGYLSVIFRSK